jgi:cytochrome P450
MQMMNNLPNNLVVAMDPSVEALIKLRQVWLPFSACGCIYADLSFKDLTSTVSRIGQEHSRQEKPKKQTIFHEIMQSNLSPQEKSPHRLTDEAQTIIGAGLVTTSWALTVAVYYLLENPPILEKLRAELFAAVPDLSAPDALSFGKLESLQYLRGCVREGIRLSYGVSCRIPRLIDTPVAYGDWVIPPGTPISMTILDIHFTETLYPKPYDFIPERWFNNPKAPDGESMEKYWVAFGKGPRNCLGIKYVYCISFSHHALFILSSLSFPLTNEAGSCY